MTAAATADTDSGTLHVLSDSELHAELIMQGNLIKQIKASDPSSSSKSLLQPHIDRLVALKAEISARAKRAAAEASEGGGKPFDRASLESLLLKRFFYAPSFAIYGGVTGLYDYGPPGTALQNNIISVWRKHFVLEEDMLEIECTNLTPESVLKTSGHVDRFSDYMVKDAVTGDIFRADHLVKQVITQRLSDDLALKSGANVQKQKPAASSSASGSSKRPKGSEPPLPPVQLSPETRNEYNLILESLDNYQGNDLWTLMQKLKIRAPETGNEVTEPRLFNLMFETQIGPTGQFRGFMRPETAQGHFLNFKRLLEFNTEQMPFASASIGKSFRNEISPRQGLLRVREFTMAEIEHFVDPKDKTHARFHTIKDIVIPLYTAPNQLEGKGIISLSIGEAVEKGIINNETLGYFIARIYLFLVKIGINPERLRFRQHMANEMAHYACDCWDAEIQSSYGWIECVGCADRSAFDLTAHSRATKEKLVVRQVLAEPIIKDSLVLEVDRKKFGPAFRVNAKHVQGYLNTLQQEPNPDDCVNLDSSTTPLWDEAKLVALQAQLDAGGGKTKVVGTDGNEYEISNELVSIVRRTEKINIREYIPSVIEPSFGLGRILYSLLEHSWWVREGDEARAVLSFPAAVAPIKALVLPISSSRDFTPFLSQITNALRERGVSNRLDDSSASIGRRYARNDELGTPFAITVDFQTVKDSTVTLRERDSLKQIREPIPVVVQLIADLVEERIS